MLVVLDVLGWVGGLLVAAGYVLVSLQRIAPSSSRFQAMNVAGAAMLGLSCVVDGALPPAFLNAIWLVIGVRSLMAQRAGRRRIEGPVPRPAALRAPA